MKKLLLALTVLLSAQVATAKLSVGDDVFLPELVSIESGEMVDLTQFEGKVIFVEFWASWCVTCAKSFPTYNKLHNELDSEEFVFISINTDKRTKDAKKFLKRTPADFLVVRDDKRAAVKTYEPKGYPSGYIVNKAGKIVAIEESQPDYEELKAHLEELIAEGKEEGKEESKDEADLASL
ncbi:MAG: TlpA family protein disulfide reductase [Saccharospirillaceae bacterium]|nr:TlpA family protein disulfide reductase [Pseudomonadales bacterium]NRB80078.1 TlpA family protein disulfide reductase [Saccharospirillaceae bacterium]